VKLAYDLWRDEIGCSRLHGTRWVRPRRRLPALVPILGFGLALAALAAGLAYAWSYL
jgi:hypothetical protein